MKHKFIFRLCCILALAVSSWGQQNPPAAPTVQTSRLGFPLFGINAVPIAGATIQIVGQPGQATWYLWAVANYTEGSVISSIGTVTNAANTLSGSNYIAIYPIYPTDSGVTVDILATQTPLQPSGSCGCAVSTGNTGGAIFFQSNTTNPYTVTLISPTSFRLWLTNEVVGSGSTHLLLRNEAGALVCDLSTGCGSGTGCNVSPAVSTGIVFINNSLACTTDTTTLSLAGNPANTRFTVHGTSTALFALQSTALGSLNLLASGNGVLGIGNNGTAASELLGTPNSITANGGLNLGFNGCNITSISRTTNVVTAVVGSPCALPVNVWIAVSGVTDSSYNGHFLTSTVSQSGNFITITYPQTGANTSSSSGLIALYTQGDWTTLAATLPLYFYANTGSDPNNAAVGVRFVVGDGSNGVGGGPIDLFAGNAYGNISTVSAGSINLRAGSSISATGNNINGGSINLTVGTPTGSGVAGTINLTGAVTASSSVTAGSFILTGISGCPVLIGSGNQCLQVGTISPCNGPSCSATFGHTFSSTPQCVAIGWGGSVDINTTTPPSTTGITLDSSGVAHATYFCLGPF